MKIIKIKTETGVVIILATAILAGIFTVVGFEKTSRDIEKIQKSVEENQAALRDEVKNNVNKKVDFEK